MRAYLAEWGMVWPADLHDRRCPVNPECEDPMADPDSEVENEYAGYELEEYSDTPPISSWAPPSALPAPAAAAPTQPAALGMPPIPSPPPPAGLRAAAEPGSAPQPWKCSNWGGKSQESSGRGKYQQVAGGAASTMQQGSAYAPIRNWLAGGAASNALQGNAPAPTPGWGRSPTPGLAAAANGMQVSTALGTGPAAVVPAAPANPSANEGNFASSSFGSSQVQAAVRNNPAGIQSTYQFSSF